MKRLQSLIYVAILLCSPACDSRGRSDIPKGAHWRASAFPVPVHIDRRFSDDRVAVLLDAISRLNTEIGREVLEPQSIRDVVPSDLVFKRGAIHVQEAELVLRETKVQATTTVLMLPGSRRLLGALIRIRPGVPTRHLLQLHLHEQGHALGLRHNLCEGCLMHPVFEAGSNFTQPELDYIEAQMTGELEASPAGDGEAVQVTAHGS